MKKVTLLVVVFLGLYGLSGCSGAPANPGRGESEPTMGYYEIQNHQGEVLYRGIYDGGMAMLDENNLSYSSTGTSTTSETDTGTESGCVFSFDLSPIDGLNDGADYEFPMDCNYSKSSYITVGDEEVRLLFDPDGRHAALQMKAGNLSDKNLADPRDSNNTFVSTGSTFALTTYLYAVDIDTNPVRCEMTGSLPSAQSNFASVEAPYTCDDDQSGTSTVGFVSPDEGYTTLLISVGADTEDMQDHILAFE